MALLRPRCEYLEKENTVEINDLAESIRRTESYRVEKLRELRREQELFVRKIRRLKEQKRSYLRQIAILTQDDDSETTMPVDYLNNFDLPESRLASVTEQNRKDMLRNPTDAVLQYIRDNYRMFIPEIERKLRDYDYRLSKLALLEQKIREDIQIIQQRETAPVEAEDAR